MWATDTAVMPSCQKCGGPCSNVLKLKSLPLLHSVMSESLPNCAIYSKMMLIMNDSGLSIYATQGKRESWKSRKLRSFSQVQQMNKLFLFAEVELWKTVSSRLLWDSLFVLSERNSQADVENTLLNLCWMSFRCHKFHWRTGVDDLFFSINVLQLSARTILSI